jgi:roadblock/LC7 domain-containing protein
MQIPKKIKTEVALGIILVIAALLGGLIYFVSREDFKVAKIVFKKKPAVSSQNQKKDLRLLFASNGDRNIYRVQKDDKWVVVIDGQESAAYDYVDNATFSPDGTLFAYSGTIDGQSVVILENTVQQQVYDKIKEILFSANGNALGYVAQKGNYNVIVFNGQESKLYQEIAPLETSSGSRYVIFSPDGKSIAYKVVDSQGSYIVINGQEGKRYDDITSFVFAQDGTYTYQAQSNGQQITVTNGQASTTTGSTSNTTSSTQNSGSSSSSQGSSGGFKKNTRDIQRDQNRLFYPTCSGGNCNF